MPAAFQRLRLWQAGFSCVLEIERAWIFHAIEEERVRWSRSGHGAIIVGFEQCLDVRQRPPAAGDIEHRSDEKAYHMMKKSIGFDLEHEAAVAVSPGSASNMASMVVVRRRRAEHCEGAKAVISLCERRRAIEETAIERAVEGELARPAERRTRFFVGADVVTVLPRNRAIPRVELGSHLEGRGSPDILREHRIQRAPQSRRFPAFWNAHTNRLSSRVHARVRPSGAECRNGRATQSIECLLHDPLNGALIGLPLPSAESSTVVVQHELHGALGHCTKTTRGGRRVKQSARRSDARKRLTLLDVGAHIWRRVYRFAPPAALPFTR